MEKWTQRDPITRFQKYLIAKGVVSQSQIDTLEEEIAAEIKEGEKRFDEQTEKLGDPLDMFNHVFAELPPILEEQKEEVRRNISEK